MNCHLKPHIDIDIDIDIGARSFSVVDPKIWNYLPLSLRTCTSPDTFRRHLKTHYTTACRPSNPLNPSLRAPQIRLLLIIVRVYKLYLLTYLLTVAIRMHMNVSCDSNRPYS